MSDSERRPKFKGYGRESTLARFILERKYRRQANRAVARGEELPRKRGTQGWHTW